MRRCLAVLTLLLVGTASARAHGLLVPIEKTIPPLAMLNHQVNITIEDQVATTRVEQTFRNHTDRNLEATYIFPVPKGASVSRFTMSVGGKEVKGELVEAAKATQIYTDIVRRTQDPGLLEYMGNNLLRVKVFPVPAHGDQKMTLSFTSIAPRDSAVVEYVYPLKTDGKAVRTLEKFSIQATIKSQHRVENIYSPTHAINVSRPNDHEAVIHFERDEGRLDRDFQLYYGVGDKDVGLTVLAHRPISTEKGYFLLLLSPRVELPKDRTIPRDMVLVLDTSGSMRGVKMDQARKALKYCLDNLGPKDRFGLINFATTVNQYNDKLLDGSKEQVEHAKKWVDDLEATGGTAIDAALDAALALRSQDRGRTFTVVFFTDGCPTIGETDPQTILKNVAQKNTANTRIFTFGAGDDVNATMLDQLAEQTRAVSSYVRPEEDIENKVSGLYSKISHPVLANLKLAATNGIRFDEVYPPQLPDLFHGGQVVVLGRYSGQGPAAVTLTGSVGSEARTFAYDVSFAPRTNDDRAFVEPLWARRKVGYLLDQIRANGQKKELVDEVTALAKKYGIATPYTSYLIVPDAPVTLTMNGRTPPPPGGGVGGPAGAGFGGGFGGGAGGYAVPAGLMPQGAAKPQSVEQFARQAQGKGGDGAALRGVYTESYLRRAVGGKDKSEPEKRALRDALEKKLAYDEAGKALSRADRESLQSGKLGVDLSVDSNQLKSQSRMEQAAQRRVAGRTCLEIGGVWIDQGFHAKTPTLTVKAMSDAYFEILKRHPEVKQVFQLGNYVVWLAPSGTALVIDANSGKEKLADADIDRMFTARK
jgi:Ca-activated chloride channel family protein